MSRATFIASALILLVASADTAAADEGQRLADEGARLFARAQFKASLRVLTRAAAAASEPAVLGRIHLYLGLNQALLGQEATARTSFTTALTHDPLLQLAAGRFRPDLIALLEAVRAGLEGELVVEAGCPGPRVLVDGGAPHATPLRRRLGIGAHRLRVLDAAGKVILDERIVVRAGQVLRRPLDARCPAPAVIDPARRRRGPVTDEGPPVRRRRWTWIAGGAALATGIAAVAVGATAMVQFNRNQTPDAGTFCYHGDTADHCQRVLRLDLAANVLYGVAGGLAATAVVLFFLEGRAPPRARGASLRLLPSAGGAVVLGEF